MEQKIIDHATKALEELLWSLGSKDDSFDRIYLKNAGIEMIKVIRVASDLEVKER